MVAFSLLGLLALSPLASAVDLPPTCTNEVNGSEMGGTPVGAWSGSTNALWIGQLVAGGQLEGVTVGHLQYIASGHLTTVVYLQVWRFGTTGCPVEKLDTIGIGRYQGYLRSVAVGNFDGSGDGSLEVVAVGNFLGGAGLIVGMRWTGPGSYTRVVNSWNPTGGSAPELRAVVAANVDGDSATEFVFVGKATYSTAPTTRGIVAAYQLQTNLKLGSGVQTAITEPDGTGASDPNELWAVGVHGSGTTAKVFATGHYRPTSENYERAYTWKMSNTLAFELRDLWSETNVHVVPRSMGVFRWGSTSTYVVAVGYGTSGSNPADPLYGYLRLRDTSFTPGNVATYDGGGFMVFKSVGGRDENADGYLDKIIASGKYWDLNGDPAFIILSWTPWSSPTTYLGPYTWGSSDTIETTAGLINVWFQTPVYDVVTVTDVYSSAYGRYISQVAVHILS